VGCAQHEAPARERLARLISRHPEAEAEAAAGAQSVLRAQVSLYDGALGAIRGRHMAAHPSAYRRQQAIRGPVSA
jgi:hypothetical protein